MSHRQWAHIHGLLSAIWQQLMGTPVNRYTTLFSIAVVAGVIYLLTLRPKGRRRARRSDARHCNHGSLRGIYGDEANTTPGNRRLQCNRCGAYLDGPASLAWHRVS